MAHLHQHFVLLRHDIRQPLDRQQIITGDCAGDGERNAGRAGGGDEARLAAGQPGDDGACLALQVVDLDEVRQHRCHRLDRFWNDDRGAEAGHGARYIDDRAKAERRADISGHGDLQDSGSKNETWGGRSSVSSSRQPCKATIASISTVMLPGSEPKPTAERACSPAGPKTAISRSEQPLMTLG